MLIVSHDVAADIAGTQTGHLIPWALERGMTCARPMPPSTAELPSRCTARFVAVLGSAQAAYDETKPWIAREREWMRGLHAAGTPILGICFGGQQLSRALGGTVSRGAYSEFGWTDIEPSPATHGVVGAGPWFSFHDDVFTVPGGCRRAGPQPAVPAGLSAGHSLGRPVPPRVHPGDAAGLARRA